MRLLAPEPLLNHLLASTSGVAMGVPAVQALVEARDAAGCSELLERMLSACLPSATPALQQAFLPPPAHRWQLPAAISWLLACGTPVMPGALRQLREGCFVWSDNPDAAQPFTAFLLHETSCLDELPQRGRAYLVGRLGELGIDLDAPHSATGLTPMRMAVGNWGGLPLARALLLAGADPTRRGQQPGGSPDERSALEYLEASGFHDAQERVDLLHLMHATIARTAIDALLHPTAMARDLA